MRKFAAVVFDIDGTLAPTVSWTDFTKRLGALPGEQHAHLKMYSAYLVITSIIDYMLHL